MGRLHTSEALVLKTYDIGDADRFCILLTESQGRLAVCAKGVRKLTSKWGSAIQSFQHIKVDLAEHSSGMYLRSAECLSSFSSIRTDVRRFTLASRGAELLMHFLHDTEPSPSIFLLAREYFEQCDAVESGPLLFSTFQMMFLKELGLLPAYDQDGSAFSSYLNSDEPLGQRSKMQLSPEDQRKAQKLCDELLQDHLSFPLKSSKVAAFSASS
jgi:DNA repair protein RecO (recombination protein O)